MLLAAWFGSNLCLFVKEKINDYDVDLYVLFADDQAKGL
jgi:hypothetical protein